MYENSMPIGSDLVAITIIAGMYFHRHQRRDLLLAYVALNIGILSVTAMLTSASVGVGLGLGLFGILSIIRLRSDSITQEEIAYYFVALALGLLAGVAAGPGVPRTASHRAAGAGDVHRRPPAGCCRAPVARCSRWTRPFPTRPPCAPTSRPGSASTCATSSCRSSTSSET